MTFANPALWFVGILLSGILLVFASGAAQIYLPARRWKKWIARLFDNLGGLSVIANTILVWRMVSAIADYMSKLLLVLVAIVAPILMILAVGLAFRYKEDWVLRRAPASAASKTQKTAVGGVIGRIKKL